MPAAPDPTTVTAALANLNDPETGRPLAETGQLAVTAADAATIAVSLKLTTHSAILWKVTRARAEELLRAAFPTVADVTVTVEPHHRPPSKIGQIGLEAKSVIAVGSGKGGVGKSTIAASIALGLARAGSATGLLDADVYGPSVPHLLGLSGRPQIDEGKIVPMRLPIGGGEMPVMSMGFLVPPGEAVVWRGPMLHGAITQMLRDTRWGPLDYLVIDMPPGTGDIALTLSQVLPLTGAVVVCTPQDVALLDATKAIAMFRKVNIPVLGMVENMAYFVCPDTGKRYDIFGSGGAKRTASELEIPFLGEVPIQIPIREHGDAGTTAANYDDPAARPYLEAICERLVGGIAAAAAAQPPLPSLPVL
ncbi:MAG: Mrp/NBP35 family ATP-binding protein [Planctomycetota bacterium]|jgi:ATP-binding protein involved in chromosome partitioning|nr:Mrp/NBP35 family ATP-binding protein [Planctomycetota bacterium]MDA1201220.1 Mrp/NBP35 family ATP-binding protein [Planctomycetota bacterium]